METKRNLLAVFLISIIILLTPTWLSLFSPEKFDSETIQKSTEKTYIEKNKKKQKKPANPVLSIILDNSFVGIDSVNLKLTTGVL